MPNLARLVDYSDGCTAVEVLLKGGRTIMPRNSKAKALLEVDPRGDILV